MEVNLNNFNEIVEVNDSKKDDITSFRGIVKLSAPLIIFAVIFAGAVRVGSFFLGFT